MTRQLCQYVIFEVHFTTLINDMMT